MKPRTSLVLLLLGIVALAGGWYFGTAAEPTGSSSVAAGRLAFPDLTARLQQAARIDITHQGKTLTLDRDGDVWGMADRGDYPVQTAKLHALLTGLAELRLTERRTADPAEFSRLGVEDPQATATSTLLRVLDGQGKPIAELIVGHQRVRAEGEVPQQVYVRRPGENQAWLAEGRLEADADPQLWFDRDLVNIDQSALASVAITRGEQHLALRRAGDKLVLEAPADHPALDDQKLADIGHALEFLSFSDVRPAGQMPGEALGQAVFTTTDGLTLTIDVNKADKDVWARLAAAGDGPAKAQADRLDARLKGWAYQVGDYKLAALLPSMDDLKAAAPSPAPPADAK
ncbi:MAG: DUF4340 domain-containing protein [Acidisphaera sp.]|nr:DUF4340 domain-containing protein [Acidisphaera sp.]